jgi:ubiquinone/menaquinone biosynthesis C-methylase UbiE
MQKPESEYFNTNKKMWDSRVGIHLESELYDLAGFREGETSLRHIELEEMCPVDGRTLLHLQCHFGLDTLSFARMGALATGIDFSGEAIRTARSLNAELGLDCTFVESNVYELKEKLSGTFDIVFTSYGAIPWLPDMERWADIVMHFLKPGGTFYMAEFHPAMYMLDEKFEELFYPYFNPGLPFSEEFTGTYADPEADIAGLEYFWNHSLSEVINALVSRGLHLEFLNEHPYSPYNCFPDMVQLGKEKYIFPRYGSKLPMMYSLRGIKDSR